MKEENINSKLLIFASNLIKEKPATKKQVNQVLNFLKKELKEEVYAPNPPFEWLLENKEKDYALYTNGLFFITLKNNKKRYDVTLEPVPFTTSKNPIKLPINKKNYSFKNVFDALGKIEELEIWFEEMCKEQELKLPKRVKVVFKFTKEDKKNKLDELYNQIKYYGKEIVPVSSLKIKNKSQEQVIILLKELSKKGFIYDPYYNTKKVKRYVRLI